MIPVQIQGILGLLLIDNCCVSAVGVSTDPCSNTYCGNRPYSEIEAQRVAEYIEGMADIQVYYTLHSHGQLWMAPWGYTTDRPENYDALVSCSSKYESKSNL